jgi:hypothetical protein
MVCAGIVPSGAPRRMLLLMTSPVKKTASTPESPLP